jgi:uncharacterized hydrophobic protein (TIGR00271 family)
MSAMTPALNALRGRIEHLLQIDPQSKPLVYLQVFKAAEIMSLNYALELLLSAGIATLGLVLNSPAVVIGAMLISPLMGPILASGLALAAADLYLGIKSLISVVLSMIAAILFSALLVWLLPFQSPTTEILARTRPNLLDLGIALFSGLAGSIVLSRGGGGGGVTALPGVAIAVALMPPLCTVGFGVGSGMSWAIISGAGLLFLTNLAAIIASAFLVFYIVRMDSPDVRMKIGYAEMEQAGPDRLYKLLEKTWLGKALGDIGHLRWRIAMLLVSLAILYFPLRKSLYQLRDETVSRSVVQEAVRSLGPADAILTQQLDLEPNRIVVHLVVASTVPAEKIREAERMIIRRTAKEASVQVRKVASEEELALLRDRLRPPPPQPPPQTLESMRADVLSRLEPLLKETWPAETTPLLGYEVGFTPEDVVVRIQYESRKPMDAGAQELLTKLLASRLQTPKVRLILDQERPAPNKKTVPAAQRTK